MQHTHAQLKRYNHLLGELEAVYHDLSYQLGMSDSDSKILYTLCCEGSPCRISDICLCSGLSKQTVNSALRKLEAQGLIYLESAGRKAKTVCLTEDGTRFAQKTAMRILNMENEILASWAPEEVAQYMDLTERFLLVHAGLMALQSVKKSLVWPSRCWMSAVRLCASVILRKSNS